MEIEHTPEAIAAESFAVTVRDFLGPLDLEIWIGQKRLTRKRCPDPPCHERIIIPRGTKGAVLTILARDAAGTEERVELVIDERAENFMTAGA